MTENERIQDFIDFMPISLIGKTQVDYLMDIGYFKAPASCSHHGAYEGGLYEHSLAVTKALVELTEKLGLVWEKPISPYIVGMFHDLCKADNYVYDADRKEWTHNQNVVLIGHGTKSVILLQKMFQLTEEEIMCIRWHMGAFEDTQYKRGLYSRAVRQYPNVLYTHTADMIASQIMEI